MSSAPGKYDVMAFFARSFLDDLVVDAARPKVPQQIKGDLALALKWLDVAKPSDIHLQHYERWSAGFAAYVAEGKAPSSKLSNVFEFFKDAPASVVLNDEIRGVFNRLLATDAEIAVQKPAPRSSDLDNQ